MIVIDKATRADDAATEALLLVSYVDSGYTPASEAAMFKPEPVFDRGQVFVARDDGVVVGMVIVVSTALRFAKEPDVELHLLAVAPSHRRQGIGRLLVNAAIEAGRTLGAPRMLLWTQPQMTDAHRLYERHGFERAPELDFVKREQPFLVYERRL